MSIDWEEGAGDAVAEPSKLVRYLDAKKKIMALTLQDNKDA